MEFACGEDPKVISKSKAYGMKVLHPDCFKMLHR